jgi:hypothetical protein
VYDALAAGARQRVRYDRLLRQRHRNGGRDRTASFTMTSRAFLIGLGLVACAACNSGRGENSSTSLGTSLTAGSADSGDETSTADTDTTMPTTTAADTEDGSTSDGELICDMQEFVLEAIPPNVVLVLDKSGSMIQEQWDADANPDTPDEARWQSLHNVVEFVVNTFEGEINFGANLFPSQAAAGSLGETACPVRSNVEVPVAPMNADGVLGGIPAADSTDIRGATPATDGIRAALDHLLTLDPMIDRFMILVTDGAANCGAEADTSLCPGVGCGLMEEYDHQLPLVVEEAFTEHGVPTFVVGIDILDELVGEDPMDGQTEANTYVELNTVAEAGGRARKGTEKFYNTVNQVELMDALSQIAGSVVSCTIPFETIPEHPTFVKIEIGGMEIDRVQDCDTENGWAFVNPDGPYDAIQLCGTACELLAETRELDALFECPPAG